MEKNCLSLLQSVADLNDAFVVIFKENDVLFTNRSFNKFFGVSSTKEYNQNFGAFVNNFVPHPYYFHGEKVPTSEIWYNAISELEEIDRVVSFLSHTHEPHAFSVSMYNHEESFSVVTFTDITQTLIKRIMTQNKTNIDARTGAYTKQYFLQIKQSFEEAASFNEKIISLISIDIFSETTLSHEDIKEFITLLQHTIRHEDMLIKWENQKFVLAFLVDDAENANRVSNKIKSMLSNYTLSGFSYELTSIHQEKKESISKLINRLNS